MDRELISGSRDKTVKLWETETGKSLRTFQGHNEEVSSVAFSPDGRWIASASRDKTVKLWDASSDVVRTLALDLSERPIVVVSPDGRFIATASLDGPLNLWDVSTLNLVRTFQTGGGVFSMAFSRDGKWLSANRGKKVSIWEALTGNLVRTLEGHEHNVLSIAFSPDSRSIASAGVDETTRLWDARTGNLIRTIATQSVVFVAFSPDASSLVAGSNVDNAFLLWDTATGNRIRIFEGAGLFACGAASLDGKWIASGTAKPDNKHVIELWDPAGGR